MDNGQKLRQGIEKAGLTQARALDAFNEGLSRPLSLGHWKGFLAAPDSSRWARCPDWVWERAQSVFQATSTDLSVSVQTTKIRDRNYQIELTVGGFSSRKKAVGMVEYLTQLMAAHVKE